MSRLDGIEQDYRVTITTTAVYVVSATSAAQARRLVADSDLLIPAETVEEIEARVAAAEDEDD